MSEELVQEIAAVGEAEDEMYEKTAPRGSFSEAPMNELIRAAEAFSKVLTGEELKMADSAPATEDRTSLGQKTVSFPGPLVRVLEAANAAISGAISADMLDPKFAFDLATTSDDTDLAMLAGKLAAAAESREFRLWAKQPAVEEEEEAPEEPEAVAPPAEDNTDILSQRL